MESGADHEIRKASFQLGGLGRAFLRSRDILQLLFAQRQEEFEEQVPVANTYVWVGACVSERTMLIDLMCLFCTSMLARMLTYKMPRFCGRWLVL